jgi:integrase
MRQYLPGIASAKKKLADGTARTYYYAWRGGPLLKSEDGKPLSPTDPQFYVAYTEAHRSRRTPTTGTMSGLIAIFRASSEFTGLSDKTRKDYGRYLRMIDDQFGDMPVAAIESPKARGEFKAWRDRLADKPRTADYAWVTLARVLSVGKDRGRISVNVCEGGGRLYRVDRTEKIWTNDHIASFCAVASSELQSALLIGVWTAQRQSDLLGLRWTSYDGTAIRLQQGKTGKRVTIPVGAPLKKWLDARRSTADSAMPILVNSRGEAWTPDGFRTSWGKAFIKSGIDDDLRFHDLRGTALTRLALAGCTVSQIAAISGQSLKDAETILDAHYLGGDLELAEAAITKLNFAYGK